MPVGQDSANQTAHLDGWLPVESRRRRYGTWKFTLLVSVPPGVFTLTGPVVAPLGTVALISVPEITSNVAAVPLKVTLLASVRSFPKIVTAVPGLPEVGNVSTTGPSPTERLKTVPSS